MSDSNLCLLAIAGFLAFLCSGFTASAVRQSQQPSQIQPIVAQMEIR